MSSLLILSLGLLSNVHADVSTSIAPSTQGAQQAITQAYNTWKADYVTSNGAGGQLRVQRSAENNYDTVSEGIGYGMLFAAYNNDQSTFNKLWSYEQSHLDPDQLMNWDIDSSNNTIGYNAATDADEDIALALVMADKTWGGYTIQADEQIQNIEKYEIENGSYVVKPGDVWGGSSLLDTSYLAPAYYNVFQSYTGDKTWTSIANESYNILNNIHQNTAASSTGLVPDWSTSTGTPASGMSYDYSYDASRGPLRLALVSDWSPNTDATSLLNSFNSFFEGVGVNNIATSYNLNGSVAANSGSNIPLLAAAAAAATVSSNTSYRTSLWNALSNAPSAGYFPDSMRLLGMLVASGEFTNPLDATQTTSPSPVPAASIANNNIDIWWPSNGSSVSGVQPFKAMLENENVNDYTMYWQVDGGQLNLMSNNSTDYPHKEADVDLSGWNWRGSGPYDITFVAKDSSGNTISTASTYITVNP